MEYLLSCKQISSIYGQYCKFYPLTGNSICNIEHWNHDFTTPPPFIYNPIRERAEKESEDEKLEREIKLDEDNRVIVQKE